MSEEINTDNENKSIQNIQNEILLVGSIYKNPNLYVEFGRFIKSKYDLSDEATRFFYDNFEAMYRTFTQDITESNVNTFMSQEHDRFKIYKMYGGYKTVISWIGLSNESDFRNYMDIVKKYSLLREYNSKGYNVQKIMNHSKFYLMKAQDIYKLIRSGVDKISTVILSNDNNVVMNKDNTKSINGWLIKPQMGLQMPFEMMNEMFKGFTLGKMFALGFLSNEGKTRLAIFIACFIALYKGEKVAFFANETDEEDFRACMLVTVINNSWFKKLHGVDINITEKELVLGIYKDSNDKIIQRETDKDGNFTEEENDYLQRVYDNSDTYRKVIQISNWIEQQTSNKIYFKRLTDYSDNSLDFEIRKSHISFGINYFIYDTLKSYKDETWTILKQTTTMLSDLMGELKSFLWADIQLTDDSVYTDIFSFSSNNISNCKQLKHLLDFLVLGKRLNKDEYHKYKIVPNNLSCWGEKTELDLNLSKVYYALKPDKNRKGEKDKIIVIEVDLNKNTWVEVGYLIRSVSSKSKS